MHLEQIESSDPKVHTANIRETMKELIKHLRRDIDVVDDTLGHLPVSCQLAAGDRQHAGRTGPELVLARDVRRRLAILGDQRPDAGLHDRAHAFEARC